MQIEQLSFELTQKAELTQKMKQHQMNYEQSNTVVEQTQKSFKLDTKKKIENNTNQLKTQTNQLENYNQILKITDKLQDGIMVDLKKSKETLLTAHEDTNTIQSDVKERALQQSIEIRIDQSVDFKEYTFDILQNMINQINGFQYVSIE